MATKLHFIKTHKDLKDNHLFEFLGRAGDGKQMYAIEELPIGKTLQDLAGNTAEPLSLHDHPFNSHIDLYQQQKGTQYGRGK